MDVESIAVAAVIQQMHLFHLTPFTCSWEVGSIVDTPPLQL